MKKFQVLYFLILLAILIYPSCQTVKVDIQAEIEAMQNLESQWTAAVKEKNIENVMNLIAADAVFMLDDMKIIEGKEAIRDLQLSWYSDTTVVFSTYTVTTETIEVSASGDLAYVRVSERYNQNTADGMVERVNKFINIWKKIEGEWKSIVLIGNSDNP